MNLLIFSVRCLYQRESVLQVFFFLKKIQENFVGTLETVCIREVSVPRDSTVVQQEKEKSICGMFTSSIKCLLTEEFYQMMSKKCTKSVLYVQTSCFAQEQYKMYKCFFDVFIAVAVIVATAALYFDLKGHSVITFMY